MAEKAKAYGYVRVSTIAQGERTSPEIQASTIQALHAYKLKETHELMPPFVDIGESGKGLFRERPGGQSILRLVEKGDAIIFSKLDRGFRNMLDLCQTVLGWHEAGIIVHFADLAIDSSSLMGKMMMTMLGWFAEFERVRMAERLAENRALRDAQGKPNGQPKFGFRIAGQGKNKYLTPDPEERALGALVVRLRDRDGLRFSQIAKLFEETGVRSRRLRTRGAPSYLQVKRYYKREKKLRAEERQQAVKRELNL